METPTLKDGLPTQTDRTRFSFEHPWFEAIRHEWEEITTSQRGKQLKVLEIGSFEGASTTWILDNLMDHPDSRMTCVDHFGGGMDHHVDPVEKYDFESLEARFKSNVAKCENGSKLNLMKMSSDDALLTLRKDGTTFNFIYIDASHVAIDVLHDAVLCWRMLEEGGTMVFDDWNWKGYMEHSYNPRIAIIGFLRSAEHELEYRETESQVWVTKASSRIKPTRNEDPLLVYHVDELRSLLK